MLILKITRTYGLNVIKSILVDRIQKTTIVGVYIPLWEVDLDMIKHLDIASKNTNESELIALRDLNKGQKSREYIWCNQMP